MLSPLGGGLHFGNDSTAVLYLLFGCSRRLVAGSIAAMTSSSHT